MGNTIKVITYDVNGVKIGTSNVSAVYVGTNLVWPSQHQQVPCFAVTPNISTYTDTEFIDVYDATQDKWYKLNNLNQYEEYGVYGSGRTITYYDGKLTIDGDYEYQYSGGTWVNVGEVSYTYTEYEYVQGNGTSYINTNYYANDNSWTEVDIEGRLTTSPSSSIGESHMFGSYHNINGTVSHRFRVIYPGSGTAGRGGIRYDYKGQTLQNNSSNLIIQRGVVKLKADGGYIGNTKLVTFNDQSSISLANNMCPFGIFYSLVYDGTSVYGSGYTYKGKIYNVKLYEGNTLVRNYVPAIKDGVVGMYETVNGVMYGSENSTPFTVGGTATQQYVIPIEYDEIQDPPNNLSFSSMTEAEEYECPWVGMRATIDGTRYVFSGDSQSGYEWVEQTSRLPVGYTEVEYIQNTSRSYLNTSFKPNQDTRIVADMQCVTSSQYARYIGAGRHDESNTIQFNYESYYNGALHISWGANDSWTTYSDCVGDYNRHIYDWDKNYFYRDKGETNQFSASTTYTSFQCTSDLGIFTYINNGSPSSNYSLEYLLGKMYSFQIYDNGTLVRDLVPCVRDNDNTVGAYDIVNDVFYYPPNYSSYPLIAGDPI